MGIVIFLITILTGGLIYDIVWLHAFLVATVDVDVIDSNDKNKVNIRLLALLAQILAAIILILLVFFCRFYQRFY